MKKKNLSLKWGGVGGGGGGGKIRTLSKTTLTNSKKNVK